MRYILNFTLILFLLLSGCEANSEGDTNQGYFNQPYFERTEDEQSFGEFSDKYAFLYNISLVEPEDIEIKLEVWEDCKKVIDECFIQSYEDVNGYDGVFGIIVNKGNDDETTYSIVLDTVIKSFFRKNIVTDYDESLGYISSNGEISSRSNQVVAYNFIRSNGSSGKFRLSIRLSGEEN